ncbi:MAG: hypothetical protein VX672_03170, partial [Planctomycetota bacterium]|nr:hypothetical protein [Planctomycetota bacterium]
LREAPTLGAVLVESSVTVPTVVGALSLIVWYWLRLGRRSVMPIRRKLRRTGLAVASVTVLLTGVALSGIDADLHPWAFILAWGGVLLLVLLAVGLAGLDALVTIRLHQKSLERRMMRDALALRRAMESEPAESDRGA